MGLFELIFGKAILNNFKFKLSLVIGQIIAGTWLGIFILLEVLSMTDIREWIITKFVIVGIILMICLNGGYSIHNLINLFKNKR